MRVETEISSRGAHRRSSAGARHRRVLGGDDGDARGPASASSDCRRCWWRSTAHSRGVIANWAAVMVGSGPYTEVFDRHVELQGRLDWICEILSHNEPNEARTFLHQKLVRSSVAAEHAAGLGPQWMHDQLVSSTQLAVRLDYESRALGFKLVPLEWWAERTQTFIDEDQWRALSGSAPRSGAAPPASADRRRSRPSR